MVLPSSESWCKESESEQRLKSKLDVENDLPCGLSQTAPRIRLLSNNQEQVSHQFESFKKFVVFANFLVFLVVCTTLRGNKKFRISKGRHATKKVENRCSKAET